MGTAAASAARWSFTCCEVEELDPEWTPMSVARRRPERRVAVEEAACLQHRGQKSASPPQRHPDHVFKDMGLVLQASTSRRWSRHGHLAIGHTRILDDRSRAPENAQLYDVSSPWRTATRARPGQRQHHQHRRARADAARAQLRRAGAPQGDARLHQRHVTISGLLGTYPGPPSTRPRSICCPSSPAPTAFWVFMTEKALRGARPAGHPPARAGAPGEQGWVVAFETAALLDIVGATFTRRSSPARCCASTTPGCTCAVRAREPQGLPVRVRSTSRPDTRIAGRRVHTTRVEIGRTLAMEHPVDADLVIPVPEPGTPAAIGYAEASKIPYGGPRTRTSAAPSSSSRRSASSASGSSSTRCATSSRASAFVVVDDSIVRGNTQRALVRMLREAGCRRGARADQLAASGVALLLRHRLRHAGRA